MYHIQYFYFLFFALKIVKILYPADNEHLFFCENHPPFTVDVFPRNNIRITVLL